MIIDRNEDIKYQIAYDPESLSFEEFLDKFEGKNFDYYSDIFDDLEETEKELLVKIRENIILKNGRLLKNMEAEIKNN